MNSRRNLPKRQSVSTNRLLYVIIIAILQIALITYMFLQFDTLTALIIYLSLEVLATVLSIYIAWRDDNPAYKISWILALLLLPFWGVILYLFLGRTLLPYNIRKKYIRSVESDDFRLAPDSAIEHRLKKDCPECYRHAEYLKQSGGYPVFDSTQASFYPVGEKFHEALLSELKKAEKFIFMEYFIIAEGQMWESIFDVLKEKAAAGVEVRVMYDDIGCFSTLKKDFRKRLTAAGIQVCRFNKMIPLLSCFYFNYRDHRKIAVIDGKVGFTGGINLADEYINKVEAHGHWKDTAVLLKGEAVKGLTSMFLQLWNFAAKRPKGTPNTDKKYIENYPAPEVKSDGYIIPYGDSPVDKENTAQGLYMQILSTAKKYVYITTPYLVIDNEMKTVLCLAAKSGVDVRIITPAHPDHWYVHLVTRGAYGRLLKSGVKIYEYTPGFMHSKVFISDNKVATVGTVNMDYRSFYMHFECGSWFCGSSCIKDIKSDYLETQALCKEILYDEWKKRSIFTKCLEVFLNLIAPMM